LDQEIYNHEKQYCSLTRQLSVRTALRYLINNGPYRSVNSVTADLSMSLHEIDPPLINHMERNRSRHTARNKAQIT